MLRQLARIWIQQRAGPVRLGLLRQRSSRSSALTCEAGQAGQLLRLRCWCDVGELHLVAAQEFVEPGAGVGPHSFECREMWYAE